MKKFSLLFIMSFSLFSCYSNVNTGKERMAYDNDELEEPETIIVSLKDDRVIALQEALNDQGADLRVDGLMGTRTIHAIKEYQKRNALPITGEPDVTTLKHLNLLN